jgi:hypothetical protein
MKKIAFAALALVLTAGIFAFTPSGAVPKKVTTYWYEFIDVPGNSATNPQHYRLMEEEPDCIDGNTVCAVKAPPASSSDLEHPNLSPSVREDTRFKN